MNASPRPNVDPNELAKFDALASRWWDARGEFRALHEMNPVRVGYIDDRANLAGKHCLDVGCGGGILSEALARRADSVLGIDLAAGPLEVAKLHAAGEGLSNLEYREIAAAELAEELPGRFDVVTCLEVLEHVPEPAALVASLADLVRPGGHLLLSTLNRTPKAFALAIVGAEYLLGLLQRGTHEYRRFIKPSELAEWGRAASLELKDLRGMEIVPGGGFRLGNNVDVNYLVHFQRPAGD